MGLEHLLTYRRLKSVVHERVFGGEPSEHQQRSGIDAAVWEMAVVSDVEADDLAPNDVAESIGRGEDSVDHAFHRNRRAFDPGGTDHHAGLFLQADGIIFVDVRVELER